MSQATKRYAQALFDLAIEKNRVSKYKKDIDFVVEAFKNVDNINLYLAHDSITKKDKKALIKKAFNKHISKDCLNFIFLLIDKGCISYYKDIFKDFHQLCNDYLNIEEGYIYSKRELSNKDIKRLEESLSSSDNTVVLKPRIDEELISGFKVVLKNKIIDYSMEHKVNDLKNHLIEKGVY